MKKDRHVQRSWDCVGCGHTSSLGTQRVYYMQEGGGLVRKATVWEHSLAEVLWEQEVDLSVNIHMGPGEGFAAAVSLTQGGFLLS